MAIKFQFRVPQTLTFPWGDFLSVQGQYGEQFLYTVEVAGLRDKLYAPPRLHQRLQEAGVGPGRVLTLTRVEGEGHRKEWVVEAVAEAAPEPVTEPVGAAEPSAAGKRNGNGQALAVEKRNGNGHPVEPGAPVSVAAAPRPLAAAAGSGPPEGVSFARLEQVMRRSLQAAWAAWCGLGKGPAFSGEDVRAVAITLFLECARKGIVLPPAPEPGEEDLPF